MSNNRVYFAAEDIDNIGSEIVKRVEDYREHLRTSGRLQLWRAAYYYYYKPMHDGCSLNSSGEEGEYTNISVNHYKNLLLHLKTMTTQARPAFEPRATNSDFKSQAQTILATGLLDYYMREKKLERYIKAGVEQALLFGEAYVRAEWDSNLGEIYGVNPETQAPQREGDIRYQNFLPHNVARDYSKDSSDDHDFYILTTYQNKWTLAAQYPELEEKILMLPTKDEVEKDFNIGRTIANEESEDVCVYEFYHRPTAALPNGRLVVCLADDVVLLDSALPYRDIPVYRIVPDELIGTTFGYSVGFDLLPVQEALDGLYSTVLTNQTTFGVQNVMVPSGHNLTKTELSGGLNLLEYDVQAGEPKALNLTSTPPEIFNFINMLERVEETLSGVNSVARGNPEASLKSGSALALVQSMAIQFSISLQQSYAQLVEDLGTATINILRDFATVPRIAVIAGKSNRSNMKQFTGDDLNLINRVVVDMGNALSKTTAGKIQIAENLMANGLIKSPDEYIQVMSTGRLEPAIEGIQAELLNIKAENEELSEGNNVPVMITDQHQTHIAEHKAILASPEARRNPELIQTVTKHIMDHMSILQDPENAPLLQILGQQVAPPQPQPPGPQVNMGQPNVLGQGPNAQVLDVQNPVTQDAAKVNQPNAPVNPLTGERAVLAGS